MNNSFTSPQDQSDKYKQFKENLDKEIDLNNKIEELQDDFIIRNYPPIDYKPNLQLDKQVKTNLNEIVFSRLTRIFKTEDEAIGALKILMDNNVVEEFNNRIREFLEKFKGRDKLTLDDFYAFVRPIINEKKNNILVPNFVKTTDENKIIDEGVDIINQVIEDSEKEKKERSKMYNEDKTMKELNKDDKAREFLLNTNYNINNKNDFQNIKKELIKIYGKKYKLKGKSSELDRWGRGKNIKELYDFLGLSTILTDKSKNINTSESMAPTVSSTIFTDDTGAGLIGTRDKHRLSDRNEVARARHAKLGSKFISIQRLNQKKLALKYPNGKNTNIGVKNLSDGMVKLLRDLITNNKFNREVYNNLSTEDKKLFDLVLVKTDLKNSKDFLKEDLHELKPTNDQLRERYNVLTGQIFAGNNNKKILEELKKVALDLYKYQMINEEDFRKILLL